MIEPLILTHKSDWVELTDPGGKGTSRVPADRVGHYLEKGFRRIRRKARKASVSRAKKGNK